MSDENKVVAAESAQLFDRKQLIKLVVEFGPLLVFFVGNSRYGIYTGTGAFMVATVVSLIASRTLLGRIAVMPLITSVFVLVFGGLTLLFLAGLNEVMWRFFSTDTWVAFKVFGIMPITFIFALCQIGILKKYEDTTSEST